MAQLRLLTIPISPYSEKARWALDRLGLLYTEERHLPVFHYVRSFKVGRVPNVPILVDGGTVLCDSSAILQHLERYADPETRLYPDQHRQAVEEWEDLFDEILGVESRRWVYFHAMQRPQMALRTSCQGVPAWQTAVAPWCYPLLVAYITRHLRISARNVHAGLEICRRIISRVDAAMSDGRSYLVGDRFTAADLTFACMMSPFLVPAEYGVRLPQPSEVSPAMRMTMEEMRATRAGQYALHLYRTFRRQGAGHMESPDRSPTDRVIRAIPR